MASIKQICKGVVTESISLLRLFLHYCPSSKTEPDSNVGERVVLIGNGPSAKEFPYAKYQEKGYSFCCVNMFAFDEELFFSIKPRFYCCVDPGFAEADFPASETGRRFLDILGRVDWDMNFICYQDEHLVVNNEHIKYRFVNHNTYLGTSEKIIDHLYAKNMASCGFQNVIVGAVYYFIMTKASHVILIGVENDWHRELIVGEDNDVYREYVHFYGVERINVTQAGQIGKGELYKYFEWYTTTLKQHAAMRKFANKKGVCVENACLKSYIDAFDKIHA